MAKRTNKTKQPTIADVMRELADLRREIDALKMSRVRDNPQPWRDREPWPICPQRPQYPWEYPTIIF